MRGGGGKNGVRSSLRGDKPYIIPRGGKIRVGGVAIAALSRSLLLVGKS